MHGLNNNDAFTLIELIVVMAIIAILVLLAAPRFLGYTKDSRVTTIEQDTKVLSDAAKVYHIKHEEWPINEDEYTLEHKILGIDKLYQLKDDELKEHIKGIGGDYQNYGLATRGRYEGQIFNIHGEEDKDGFIHYGNGVSNKKPVTFKGVDYEDFSLVPEDDPELYLYSEINGGYTIDGFNEEYINGKLDGVIPKEISLPSTYKGKPVIAVSNYREELGTKSFNKLGLENVIFTNNIKRVGVSAFSHNNIQSLVLPDNIERAESSAFSYNKMENIVFSNSLKILDYWTYAGNNFNHVDIPASVTTIGNSAFSGTKMNSVFIPSSVKRVDHYAFLNSRLRNLELPISITHIGQSAFVGNMFTGDKSFVYARNKDGSIDSNTLVSYAGAERNKVIVPDGVKTIKTGTFFGIGSLRHLYVPDSVEQIERKVTIHSPSLTVDLPKHTIIEGDTFHESTIINRRE